MKSKRAITLALLQKQVATAIRISIEQQKRTEYMQAELKHLRRQVKYYLNPANRPLKAWEKRLLNKLEIIKNDK